MLKKAGEIVNAFLRRHTRGARRENDPANFNEEYRSGNTNGAMRHAPTFPGMRAGGKVARIVGLAADITGRKDGTLYTEEQSTTPVRDNQGEISHFVAIKQDIAERKRAEEESQRNLERIRALREIDLAINSTLDLRTVLDLLLEKIQLFIPIAAAGTVRLFNCQTGDLKTLACRGINEDEWKALRTSTPARTGRRVAETKTPLTVLNLLTDPLTDDPELFRKWNLVSYLGVPLIAHGDLLGVLNLYTRHEHEFTSEEIEFFNTLAGQAAIAIHNAQQYEAITRSKGELELANHYLERSLSRLSSLYTALMPLAPAESIDETLAGIVDRLLEATGADAALIRLLDKETASYVITGHRGFPDEYLVRVKATPAHGAVDWAIKNGEPIIAPDIALEPRFRGKVQIELGLLSCAVLPLKVQNEVRGIIHVASRKLGYFNEEQKYPLMAIARQMGIALENKELFEHLRASRDELEKANKIKDNFLSIMSHELKTPLMVFMGYAELLRSGIIGALNNEQHDALKRMLGCAGEQLSIINNILETIQLETRTTAPQYQRVNVANLLDVLKSEYENRASTSAIKLVWRYPIAPLQVKTDLMKLKQILHNLINNGIKFTDQGSVTVSAKMEDGGEKVAFAVSDTGIGMSQPVQQIIFNKFYQLDSSETRRYGGVGLGLHMAKTLTELLGGNIKVESTPGEGSTFTVSIPRAV